MGNIVFTYSIENFANFYSFAFFKVSNFSLPIFNNSSNNFTVCETVSTQVVRKGDPGILFPILQQLLQKGVFSTNHQQWKGSAIIRREPI
ncbi:MAG: hypothetical protein BGO33_10730 [Bacteroidia bacterium 43-41]|nr:MAG: hypothetical protein BGO33_10730 [Bacteroidia bacterium 43-41]